MSKETVTPITDKVIEEMQAWSTRGLNEVYAVIFIAAIIVKVCDGQVANSPGLRRDRGEPGRGDRRRRPVGRHRR